jgi:hypothetical protein
MQRCEYAPFSCMIGRYAARRQHYRGRTGILPETETTP